MRNFQFSRFYFFILNALLIEQLQALTGLREHLIQRMKGFSMSIFSANHVFSVFLEAQMILQQATIKANPRGCASVR